MADFRRVYCTFCQQAFMTASADQCSLCCKTGGLLDEGSPEAIQHLRAAKGGPPAASPLPQVARTGPIQITVPQRRARREVSFSVPPQVAASASELGRPIARFASNALHVWVYFACGVILLALAVAIFASLVLAVSGGGGPVRPVLGTFMAIGGVGLMLRARSLLGARLFAFEGGVARVASDVCETMRWQDVAVVHRGNQPGDDRFTVSMPKRLSLRDHAGREWVFTESLSDFEGFRDLVEDMTLPSLLASALQDVELGSTLSFGDVGVKTAGLTALDKPLLGWPALAEFGIVRGHVVAMVNGLDEPYFVEPLFRVPNAHLLLALVSHFTAPSA